MSNELPPLPAGNVMQKHEDVCGNEVGPPSFYFTADQMADYARVAVLAEREACADACEAIADEYQLREGHRYPELKSDANTGASDCAAAIRARNPPMSTEQDPCIFPACQHNGCRRECAGVEQERAALAAAPQVPAVPQWQPIDTAPKDGRVLLWWGGSVVFAGWLDNSKGKYPWAGWQTPSLTPRPRGEPTHWMPLPAPPSAAPQPAERVPLTDEQCDSICMALDDWARDVCPREYGLPIYTSTGSEPWREIIRSAAGVKEPGNAQAERPARETQEQP